MYIKHYKFLSWIFILLCYADKKKIENRAAFRDFI